MLNPAAERRHGLGLRCALLVCVLYALQPQLVSASAWEELAKRLGVPASLQGGTQALEKMGAPEMKKRGFGIGVRNRILKWQRQRQQATGHGDSTACQGECKSAVDVMQTRRRKTSALVPSISTGVPGYEWDDPLDEHGRMGMMFQQRGDNARSLHAFRAAARFTRNPNTLINVGVALARQGNNVQAIRALHAARMEGIRYNSYSTEGAVPIVQKSWATHWRGVLNVLRGGVSGLPRELKPFYNKDGNALGGDNFATPLWRDSLKKLVAFKCDEQRLRIDLGAPDLDPHVDREKYEQVLDKAADTLAACGVVVLRNAMRKEHTQAMRDSADAQFKRYLQHELEVDPRSDCPDCERHNISQRSLGRWELKVPSRPPWTDEETFNNPATRGVMRRLVGRKVEAHLEIDTFSVVTSLSQTPSQAWHKDMSPIYRPTEYTGGTSVQLPPFGFVNFIPLADTPLELGPTEFLLKSHLPCKPSARSQSDDAQFLDNCRHAEKAGTWHATAQMGDAVLFDLRTKHRGGQNRADKDRSQIYLTFVKESYLDAINFVKFQTSGFDSLPPSARKRLSRVDQLEYIQQLEAKVTELGGAESLQKMKSNPRKEKYYRKMTLLSAADDHAVAF